MPQRAWSQPQSARDIKGTRFPIRSILRFFCNEEMFCTLLAAIVGLTCAPTPGVDLAEQMLFNSSGTHYPTDFTRDIVPVGSLVRH